jgi:hypothetical protein
MEKVGPWEGEDERPLKANIYLLISILLLVGPSNSYRYRRKNFIKRGRRHSNFTSLTYC